MFLEFETRDGDWVCINVEQIIMVQSLRTDESEGYTKINLSGGAVIETLKPYRTFINKVLQYNKRFNIY